LLIPYFSVLMQARPLHGPRSGPDSSEESIRPILSGRKLPRDA
jgi:hypothetical protein